MGWQMGNVNDTGWYRRKANTEMNGWRPVWRVNIPIKYYKIPINPINMNFGAMLWSNFFFFPCLQFFQCAPFWCFWKNPTGWSSQVRSSERAWKPSRGDRVRTSLASNYHWISWWWLESLWNHGILNDLNDFPYLGNVMIPTDELILPDCISYNLYNVGYWLV